MAKPIEATPLLNEEEWNNFIKMIQNTARKPLKKHSVNVNELRRILEKGEKKHEPNDME